MPAVVRFVSYEPALGPVDFTNVGGAGSAKSYGAHGTDVLTPYNRILRPQLDWIIAGGESGASPRPMNPDWARAVRDQCAEAGVAFLFKQWGGRTPKANGRLLDGIEHNGFPPLPCSHGGTGDVEV